MTPTPAQRARILSLSDQGTTPAAIASDLALPVGAVYAALRVGRPNRSRVRRPRTSEVPAKVLGLAAAGVAVPRVAALLGVSRAYVYRIMAAGAAAGAT